MVRGLYAAASGMNAEAQKAAIFAANLANVSTAGYRASRMSQSSFASDLAAARSSASAFAGGTHVTAASMDMSPGPIVHTENDFDLAINGQGFFCIQSSAGIAYTRNGQFQLNAESILVTRNGDLVLGENGPIEITSGTFSVGQDGRIFDGQVAVDTLRVVEFADPSGLEKLGDGLVIGGKTIAGADFAIEQGAYESSNVSAIDALQRMMNGQRLYEANARALQTQDQSIETLLRESLG